jgi:hypothetical protein
MSKSKKPIKFYEKTWADEEQEYDYQNHKNAKERRKQKKLTNMIRSKNISGLMEMEDD